MSEKFFEWSDELSTKIPVVDKQHKVLINILNELYEVVLDEKKGSKMIDIVNELIRYTVYHFNEEEKLFKKHNFPEEESHIKEHEKFVKEIKEINKRRAQGEDMTATLDLINFLKNWLINHIMVTDQVYVQYFEKKNIVVK